MDLVVCTHNTPRLLRNEAQQFKRNWLEIKVTGTESPTTGIGSKVTVLSPDRAQSWIREIQAGRGTGNQDEAVAHFGLGLEEGPFIVEVHFPSGKEVVLDNVQCCQLIEINEP